MMVGMGTFIHIILICKPIKNLLIYIHFLYQLLLCKKLNFVDKKKIEQLCAFSRTQGRSNSKDTIMNLSNSNSQCVPN